MCRWLAYTDSPVLMKELLYKPEHSLIDQSRHVPLPPARYPAGCSAVTILPTPPLPLTTSKERRRRLIEGLNEKEKLIWPPQARLGAAR